MQGGREYPDPNPGCDVCQEFDWLSSEAIYLYQSARAREDDNDDFAKASQREYEVRKAFWQHVAGCQSPQT